MWDADYMVRKILGYGAATILCLCILCLLALALVPAFLDHIYYTGPQSSHYDGERFYNPDGNQDIMSPAAGSRLGFAWRVLTGRSDRAAWPDRVNVARGLPWPALAPCPALTGGARVENWANCARTPPPADMMSANWIGHASTLVQVPGLAILTDPVFSDSVGPFGIGPSRVARPGVAIDDLPKIGLIVISHNHYDHMDLDSLEKLWRRDRPTIIVSLGNEKILASRGIPAIALDWGQNRRITDSVTGGAANVRVVRNHHWSSRWGSDRSRALWSAFVIDTGAGRIFFAGDTGFGDGRWGAEAVADGVSVRLAILPIGAFRFRPGQMHVDSHMGPVETARIWNSMGRPTTIPMHWGTIRLSNEAYFTPPNMLAAVLRCAGAGESAARFAAWPIGPARLIPPVTTSPAISDARIAACANDPAVQALP